MATTSGVVRLLTVEPSKEERYAHALALLATLSRNDAAAGGARKPAG